MFGTKEVLAPAKSLLELDGVEIAKDITEVTYYHFLLDRHEIVVANGAETESLYTGPEALRSISPEAREEVISLFPKLELHGPEASPPAREIIKNQQGKKLAARHAKNQQCVVLSS